MVLLDFGDIEREAIRMHGGALAARDTAKPMSLIAFSMLEAEKAVFRSQGRRGGGSWKQLKDDTKRKKGMSKILYTSGANEGYSSIGDNALFRSVTELGAPYQVLHISDTIIEFGTDRPYAGAHEFGSKRRPDLPKRPFIRFTPYDINRWRGILWNHLLKPFTVANPTKR
jgi:phage gpG-like protein